MSKDQNGNFRVQEHERGNYNNPIMFFYIYAIEHLLD